MHCKLIKKSASSPKFLCARHTLYSINQGDIIANKPRRPSRGGGRNNNRNRKDFRNNKKKESSNDDVIEVEGVIVSVLAGTMFKVALPTGHEVLAHISGKMRKRFIRLVAGDKVRMEMSPYDTSKARIVFRLG